MEDEIENLEAEPTAEKACDGASKSTQGQKPPEKNLYVWQNL